MPSVHTPGCACAGSLVKASTATPAGLRDRGDGSGLRRVSGPRISPAPAAIASCAASAAPLRRAAGVLGVERRRAGRVERELRRIQHGLAELGARPGQRQQDRDRCPAGPARRRTAQRRTGSERAGSARTRLAGPASAAGEC